jgi:GxxExxY protein
MEFDQLSHRVIGCAIEVHRVLGPGLLESACEQCLAREFELQGIGFRLQHPQPVGYKEVCRAADRAGFEISGSWPPPGYGGSYPFTSPHGSISA